MDENVGERPLPGGSLSRRKSSGPDLNMEMAQSKAHRLDSCVLILSGLHFLSYKRRVSGVWLPSSRARGKHPCGLLRMCF